jgi:hypothetical protein
LSGIPHWFERFRSIEQLYFLSLDTQELVICCQDNLMLQYPPLEIHIYFKFKLTNLYSPIRVHTIDFWSSYFGRNPRIVILTLKLVWLVLIQTMPKRQFSILNSFQHDNFNFEARPKNTCGSRFPADCINFSTRLTVQPYFLWVVAGCSHSVPKWCLLSH